MPNDEKVIRELVDIWLRATAKGDLPQILNLMAEDVVFLIPGQPPMRGKSAFAAGFKTALEHFRIDSTSDIQEIKVSGDLAYCWNHLTVTMTPLQGGPVKRRTGYTLTVLNRQPDGAWVVVRDANLLTAEGSASTS